MLTHLLGPLQPPHRPRAVSRWFSTSGLSSMASRSMPGLADEAYVYVPQACRSSACRVHVAFHGCRQSAAQIGRRFVDGAGYNAWADNNRIVVLYPQTIPRHGLAFGSWKWVNNPFACWDWWGYSGATTTRAMACRSRPCAPWSSALPPLASRRAPGTVRRQEAGAARTRRESCRRSPGGSPP
jgi:hypothetical protein